MRFAGQQLPISKQVIADEIRQALALEQAAQARGYRSWAEYQAAELNYADPRWDAGAEG